MKIACYTDIHNQQCMLNLPTVLRASAIQAAAQTVEEFGKVDLSILGGDYFSDYPYWNRSCALPKKNWQDIKQKLTDTFAKTAKGERVLYVSGNNDLLLADLPTPDNEPYNTCEFYSSGPMNQTLGELSDDECYKRYSKIKGKQAGFYYLAFHYVVDGVDFFGLNIDPDDAFNNHDCFFDYEALKWLKNKLNEVDPQGHKLLFVVGHNSFTVRTTDGEIQKSDFDEKRYQAIKDTFLGHKNLFYLYGHVHGQDYLRSASYEGILHFDKNGDIINHQNHESFRRTGTDVSFHTVHMGGLRPFKTDTPFEYFEKDGLVGQLPGMEGEQYYEATGTPKISQYLLIDTFDDRVVFSYRNAGSLAGFTVQDKPKSYTVYL